MKSIVNTMDISAI